MNIQIYKYSLVERMTTTPNIQIPTISHDIFNQHPITTLHKNDIYNFANLVNSNHIRKTA
jgi:hypothetical protein